MICDLIANAPQYASLHPAFAHCFRWLAAFDGTTRPFGLHMVAYLCGAALFITLGTVRHRRPTTA